MTIEEILTSSQPWLNINEVAVLMRTTVDGVRAKLRSGTIPPPRRGRPLLWSKKLFWEWINEDPGDWMPPPYKALKPSKAA